MITCSICISLTIYISCRCVMVYLYFGRLEVNKSSWRISYKYATLRVNTIYTISVFGCTNYLHWLCLHGTAFSAHQEKNKFIYCIILYNILLHENDDVFVFVWKYMWFWYVLLYNNTVKIVHPCCPKIVVLWQKWSK